MFWLFNPHVVAALIATAALAVSFFSGYFHGKKIVEADFDRYRYRQAQLDMDVMARERERLASLNKARQQAEIKYVQEKKRNEVAAAAAQFELDQLRNALAAASSDPPASSPSPGGVDDTARPVYELFGNCAKALTGMAAEADRLEGLVIGLQGYVNNICQK